MLLVDALLFLFAALSGAAVTWLGMRRRASRAYERGRSDLQSTVSALEQKVEGLEAQLDEARATKQELREQVGTLREERSTLAAKNEELTTRLAEQDERLEEQQDRLRDQFENLANDILEEKAQKFTKQNAENLDQLLNPLQEKMEAFKKTVKETYEEGLEKRSRLEQKIEQLTELNQEVTEQASDLTEALEGQSRTQGEWGEMILERILEESGLQEGREYETQVSETDGQGNRLRPDIVVQLPDDRYVVVDAKVSLTAYRRFVSADGEEERTDHLDDHLRSVRTHINGLADRKYGRLYGDRSPDFVLMFVPIEPAFAVTLEHDDTLYQDAFDQNVIIVSPTTLQATLATISNIWRQERQNQNAREIAERGGRLYDKFVLFAEALEEVGNRLEQAQESFHTARKRLTDGRGNLVRQVEMLRDLGAENSKQLPDALEQEALQKQE